MKDFPKTWVLTGNSLTIQDNKKTETYFSAFQKTPVRLKDPKTVNWKSSF